MKHAVFSWIKVFLKTHKNLSLQFFSIFKYYVSKPYWIAKTWSETLWWNLYLNLYITLIGPNHCEFELWFGCMKTWAHSISRFEVRTPEGGWVGRGGGGVLTQNFGRHVPRHSHDSVNWARAPDPPDRAPHSSVKMRGSGPSLSRFERENAGLRIELEQFWGKGSLRFKKYGH